VIRVLAAYLHDPAAGRPARRYYRLTTEGAEAARLEIPARGSRRAGP
jgi:DNA-binding PadR family transcriptional regulator